MMKETFNEMVSIAKELKDAFTFDYPSKGEIVTSNTRVDVIGTDSIVMSFDTLSFDEDWNMSDNVSVGDGRIVIKYCGRGGGIPIRVTFTEGNITIASVAYNVADLIEDIKMKTKASNELF